MDRRRPAGTMVRRLPACDWYVGCQPAKKRIAADCPYN